MKPLHLDSYTKPFQFDARLYLMEENELRGRESISCSSFSNPFITSREIERAWSLVFNTKGYFETDQEKSS